MYDNVKKVMILNIVIFIISVIGIASVMVSWLKADLKCPPPKVIYRFVPKHTLDVQFGEENSPSIIYEDMFNKGTPWIGGFELGDDKTYGYD